MKYIDADKLTKAIEDKGLDCSFALKMERLDTLALIDELQQEQSMPDSTELIAKWEEEKDVLKQMNFRGDEWRLAQNAFMDGVGIGLSVKQEQPEVDLDKLVNEEFASHSRTTEYGLEVTYNRAELYQLIKRMALVFNARKE